MNIRRKLDEVLKDEKETKKNGVKMMRRHLEDQPSEAVRNEEHDQCLWVVRNMTSVCGK